MNIVYSFIFYFVVFMFGLTLCLTIFVLKPARTLLYSLRTRFGQIFTNEFFVYSIYLIFAIIILILGESILNFSALKTYFRKRSKHSPDSIGLDDLSTMSESTQQAYLIQLKQYREYYMSERNIMLTLTALFVFFAFNRLLSNILKYSQTEHRVQMIEEERAARKRKSE